MEKQISQLICRFLLIADGYPADGTWVSRNLENGSVSATTALWRRMAWLPARRYVRRKFTGCPPEIHRMAGYPTNTSASPFKSLLTNTVISAGSELSRLKERDDALENEIKNLKQDRRTKVHKEVDRDFGYKDMKTKMLIGKYRSTGHYG